MLACQDQGCFPTFIKYLIELNNLVLTTAPNHSQDRYTQAKNLKTIENDCVLDSYDWNIFSPYFHFK